CANASKVEFYKTAIAAIINIFLNLFFIKKWGAVGACISSLIAYFIANVFIFFCIKRTRFIINIYLKAIFWRY
ncbi:polysaccharide biosynthesis C-terminal domain-containing protein, partial [Escherichia coli]|nr:polysaccharide biosynthesis C-terminal domain-containing protein [Escherichia coli]